MFDKEHHGAAMDAKLFYPDFQVIYPSDEEVSCCGGGDSLVCSLIAVFWMLCVSTSRH